MAKKKKQKVKSVKSLFYKGQITIQDLIEEIKSRPSEKLSKKEIQIKKQNLKRVQEITIKPLQNKLIEIDKKLDTEKDYFERLRLANERVAIQKKLERPDFNLDWMKNDIKKAEGKDFYYTINTQFGVHKIKRSQILKEKSNKLFLELMKKDVLKSIKELKADKKFDNSKKIRILKEKLLPVIEFNLQIDSVREADINKIEKKLKGEITKASNPDIDKEEKEGKYPIEVLFSEELIEFL